MNFPLQVNADMPPNYTCKYLYNYEHSMNKCNCPLVYPTTFLSFHTTITLPDVEFCDG